MKDGFILSACKWCNSNITTKSIMIHTINCSVHIATVIIGEEKFQDTKTHREYRAYTVVGSGNSRRCIQTCLVPAKLFGMLSRFPAAQYWKFVGLEKTYNQLLSQSPLGKTAVLTSKLEYCSTSANSECEQCGEYLSSRSHLLYRVNLVLCNAERESTVKL